MDHIQNSKALSYQQRHAISSLPPHCNGGGLVAKLYQSLATPWTVAHQAPLSMDFTGKNTEVGCQFLLQEIFLIQGSNPGLLP